jgi:serine/threonine-protein kinase SRPK3
MVTLLGPPPPQLLAASGSRAHMFFEVDGSAKGTVPKETLESLLLCSLECVGRSMTLEESEAFLAFIRKTLTWTEETRASASELIKDPWLAGVNDPSLPRVN